MKVSATFYDRIRVAAEAVAEHLDATGSEVAVVLGSGLATAAERMTETRSLLYASLPGFPETTVAGHPGRLICGRWAGRKSLVFCGRVHGYEGYPATEVGFGVRVAATLGVGTLIVTNVSGGIDPSFEEGEIIGILLCWQIGAASRERLDATSPSTATTLSRETNLFTTVAGSPAFD